MSFPGQWGLSTEITTVQGKSRRIYFGVEEISQDAVKNTTTLKWTVSVNGDDNKYFKYTYIRAILNARPPTNVLFEKSSTSSVFPNSNGERTGTVTVVHNSDGTLPCVIQYMGYVAGIASDYHDFRDDRGFSLTPIDRSPATLTLGTPQNITGTGATIPVTADANCNKWEYRYKKYGETDYNSWRTFSKEDTRNINLILTGLKASTGYQVQVRATKTLNKIVSNDYHWVNVKTLGASTFTTQPVIFGDACDLTWKPNDTSFKYKITYEVNGISVTSGYIEPGTTDEYHYTGYTVPLSLCNAVTDKTSAQTKVTLTTYQGSTEVGLSNKTVMGYVPETVVPVISGFSATELTGNPFSSPTENISKFRFSVQGQKAYGADIMAAEVRIHANILTEVGPATSFALVMANPIYTSGTIPYTITLTDARGRQSRAAGTVTVQPYSPPVVNVSNAISGTTVTTTVNWSISSVNGENSVQELKVTRTAGADEEIKTWTVTGTSGTQTWTQTLTDLNLRTYNYEASITDKCKTVTADAQTGLICISRLAGGKGVALFKEAERPGLDVSGDMYLYDHDTPVGAYEEHTFTDKIGYLNTDYEDIDSDYRPKLTPGVYIITLSATLKKNTATASAGYAGLKIKTQDGMHSEKVKIYKDATGTPKEDAMQVVMILNQTTAQKVYFQYLNQAGVGDGSLTNIQSHIVRII